jgi:hypothetical protein
MALGRAPAVVVLMVLSEHYLMVLVGLYGCHDNEEKVTSSDKKIERRRGRHHRKIELQNSAPTEK